MPQWVGWGYVGQTGSQSGQNWVKCGSKLGHMGHPSHVDGSMGNVGPMGHVGHWASEICLKASGATGFCWVMILGY